VSDFTCAGIPIEIALRFIIIISARRLNVVLAPTNNIALNVVLGTDETTRSDFPTKIGIHINPITIFRFVSI